MASLSTHPFHIALDEAMRSVVAASRDVNHAASSAEDSVPWRSQLRALDQDLLGVLGKLQDIEDEFVQSTKKE